MGEFITQSDNFVPKLSVHETTVPIKKYKTMKIGIVGAHGTGKTTLARQLSEAVGLSLISEQARLVHEKGFKLEQEANFNTQLMIWFMQLNQELQYSSCISDRTLLDVCVYAHSLLDRCRFSLEEEEVFKQLVNTTECLMRTYDHIFYLPITFPLTGDEVRTDDPYYQHEIDAIFQHYLNDMIGSGYSTLPLEGRLEQAVYELKG